MGALFLESIKHFKQVGTFFKTSPALIEAAIKASTISCSTKIVELGTGTGNTTERILSNVSDQANFIGLEINKTLAEVTQQRCPGATIYNHPAEDLPVAMSNYGMDKADVVFSTIPWTLLSETEQSTLLHTISQCLKPSGEFITLAYWNGLFMPGGKSFKQLLQDNFSTYKQSKIVWNNMPPAIFYQAYK